MEAPFRTVALGIAAYVLCSSLMLLCNKLVITFMPVPAIVFCIQLASAVAFVLVGRALNWLAADEFTWVRVYGFAPYIFLFVVSVYCNGRALASANAETVIVFRASSPLFVSILDVLFLGRSLPSKRSLASLCGVFVGAVGYMQADSEFQLNGVSAYFWVSVYTIAIVCEMTYGKLLLSTVKFDAPVWGSVLFTNAMGFPPMLVLALASGEMQKLETIDVGSSLTLVTLAISCVIGIGIGWSGWNCRNLISATSYTLLGVVCKLLTVSLNVLIWNKHATPVGILWLLVCLAASSLYQQAPMRETAPDVHQPAQRLGKAYQLASAEADDSDHDNDNNACVESEGRTGSV
eukprot:TRINITY_DN27449_c0_g1_i1.p1 TRINITY_DN27449_c0_g1~~TRINITY_DN27449_c0_g1_i1.p1  ORF type:complete len:348 (-),score=40.22 TRINITY_DN27449_c0_g1_i1:39-1082(-)